MSKPYAIVRVRKLKTLSNVRSASNHHVRSQPTANADPSRPVVYSCQGGGTPYDAVVRRLARVEHWRRDNVRAVELILTASPAYFRPDDPAAYGVYDEGRLQDFARLAVNWLEDRYAANLVSISLHLDEATPHIHAIVVPLVNGRLSARSLFALKGKFSEIQDSFAAVMAPLGLQRGRRRSSATHQEIRDWYQTEPERLQAASDEVDRQRQIVAEKRQELERRLEAAATLLDELAKDDPDAAAELSRQIARTGGKGGAADS